MRRLPFLLLALLMTFATFAQDAAKTVKSGNKALAKYTADMTDMGSYQAAMDAAMEATKLDPSLSGAWMLLGDVYAADVKKVTADISSKNEEHMKAQVLNPAAPAPDFSTTEVPAKPAEEALAAYKKAYETSTKSSYKKSAKDAMQQLSADMGMVGNAMLGATRYADAYKPLQLMGDVDTYFRANNEDPIFADDDKLNQQKYITAVVAQQAGDKANAMKLYKELYDANYDEAAVFANYSNMLMAEGQKDQGLEILNKGRTKYPDNSEILFAEINYYIQAQDFTTLEQKLQQAIAAEPDNVGLYTALGNVYMNLSGKEKDAMKADEYTAKSMQYFTEATNRDPENVDAIYSMGSMKFNKAVALNSEMQNLGNTKADQAKYEEMNKEVTTLFDEALPYFTKAEKIDPNDRNTMIALKEIYARKGDYETSNKYKSRLEATGGK